MSTLSDWFHEQEQEERECEMITKNDHDQNVIEEDGYV